MTNDTELMAALFVSDEGELRLVPENADQQDFKEDELYRCSWEHCGAIPSCVRSTVWSRLSVPEAVAAGILRLIRERDEARELAERYGGLNEVWPWEIKP